jgi:hypothetical protein
VGNFGNYVHLLCRKTVSVFASQPYSKESSVSSAALVGTVFEKAVFRAAFFLFIFGILDKGIINLLH